MRIVAPTTDAKGEREILPHSVPGRYRISHFRPWFVWRDIVEGFVGLENLHQLATIGGHFAEGFVGQLERVGLPLPLTKYRINCPETIDRLGEPLRALLRLLGPIGPTK